LTTRTGVIFTNILRAAFLHADPKSAKKTDNLNVFLALSGSARAKAAQKMLVKLTPGQYHDSTSKSCWQRANLPTFYEQLFDQFPFDKKLQTKDVHKYRTASQNTFIQKSLFVKCWGN